MRLSQRACGPGAPSRRRVRGAEVDAGACLLAPTPGAGAAAVQPALPSLSCRPSRGGPSAAICCWTLQAAAATCLATGGPRQRRRPWRDAPTLGPASVRSTRCGPSGPTASSTPTQGAPTRSSIQRQTWPRAPRRPACPALRWRPCRGAPARRPPRRSRTSSSPTLAPQSGASSRNSRGLTACASRSSRTRAPPSSSRSTGPRA